MTIASAKCPKCERVLSAVLAKDISLTLPNGKSLHGLSYECSWCHVLISVQYDPTSHTHDITTALKK